MFRVNVQNIRKEYRIYAKPHDRLLEALLRKPKHKVFSVLEDISFDIRVGRSLGVIGDNGAGKSTLLKLLAGTVQPTYGSIEMNGRVAALLELGAGFHPEFSGRQNINLNASLLGISQEEIRQKENEIIEFAELEQFIDRPVRTYSSGMYIRLAFSIATMVDPDILIIDEALAVGDMAFQKKCINRMNYFKQQGKTMLFCSHSMYHVQELCDRVIWLENGRVKKYGKCDEVVSAYSDFCNQKKDGYGKKDENDEKGKKFQPVKTYKQDCKINSIAIKTGDGIDSKVFESGKKMIFEMYVEILVNGVVPNFGFAIMTVDDDDVIAANLTNYDAVTCGPYSAGEIIAIQYKIDFLPLRVGSFMVLGAVADNTGLLWYDSKYLGPITIVDGKGMGRISLKGNWKISGES